MVLLKILEIIVGVALIAVILLQMQGSGISGAFGGSSGEFFRSKRSVEKILFYLTIALAIVFGILSLLLLITR